MKAHELAENLRKALQAPRTEGERLGEALSLIAETFGAKTCTLHEAVSEERTLRLRAHRGLPQEVARIVAVVPFGKGMAGACAERREAVTTCNLQEDGAGVARPRARQTGVEGALVVPLFRGQELVGTLGVGKGEPHDYSADERELLATCGELVLAEAGQARSRPPR